jgi:hypothetical protein
LNNWSKAIQIPISQIIEEEAVYEQNIRSKLSDPGYGFKMHSSYDHSLFFVSPQTNMDFRVVCENEEKGKLFNNFLLRLKNFLKVSILENAKPLCYCRITKNSYEFGKIILVLRKFEDFENYVGDVYGF